MEKICEKFLRYVSLDTQSADGTEIVPSTAKQKELSCLLKSEIEQLGFKAETNEYGYVYGFIPANNGKETPVIGLIAHIDTAPDISGANIKANVVKNYDGTDIILNKEKNIVLSAKQFSHLSNCIGEDIICTDGTTLLGADDKAGIAEIMSLLDFISQNPDFKHGEIRVAFTPDEEIGHGAELLDLKKFGADYAYTIDGGTEGEIEYENFNAASLTVTVNGVNIHPGSAKNQMINSQLIAIEFNSLLPAHQVPECTEGYEGFYLFDTITGNVEKTVIEYIIRDHDRAKFEYKKDFAKEIAEFLNKKYGENTVIAEITDSYYNMKEKIVPNMFIIDNLIKAMEKANVTPDIVPIRGGTDGARLSFRGLPCPNMGTGGQNFHGRYEYITVQAMERVVEIIKALVSM